jgi:UDP-N-acetylmuramoylalanine--D-glutamate ligase
LFDMDWKDERVLIIGAARQGTALARFVSSRGGQVVINDRASEETLEGAQKSLAGLKNITWVLGEHPLAILDEVSVVCVSGGIPLEIPIVVEAFERGLPVTNDSQIFLEEVPCPVIGITGSAGKTTTTAMVGQIVQEAFNRQNAVVHSHNGRVAERRAWVGGNIGNPLISQVDEMSPDDLAVMELSSFQLEIMTFAPQIAVLLNLTPNHLDRHKTMAAYTAAKSRILINQNQSDIAVLGHDDPGAWDLAGLVKGELFSFGLDPRTDGGPGAYLCGDDICVRSRSGEQSTVLPVASIQLRGAHNLLNVIGAVAIAFSVSISAEAIHTGVRSFAALPHRLEFVRQWGGGAWYNDSIATAPERALAAVRSFSEPLILLIGGRDKDLPWDAFLEVVKNRVDHLVVFGEAGEKIAPRLDALQLDQKLHSIDQVPNLEQAVLAASRRVKPGDVVLLSPGGTSFDEFKDFEERGEVFKQWVMELS